MKKYKQLTSGQRYQIYGLKQARSLRDERKQACLDGKQFSSDEWAEAEKLIRAYLSPEQAADRLALEGRLQISHETIYQHIYVCHVMEAMYASICADRSRIASVMRAGKSGGA